MALFKQRHYLWRPSRRHDMYETVVLEQDKQLEQLGQSVERLGEVAVQINDELYEHWTRKSIEPRQKCKRQTIRCKM